MNVIKLGQVEIEPVVADGELQSIGKVSVCGVPLRSEAVRFLPWFDTLAGDVFRRFKLKKIEQDEDRVCFHTQAISDPDVMFREERDSSGDLVFRNQSWDVAPMEVDFRIVVEHAASEIEGQAFEGIRYWFEFDGEVAVHRILDRQTWEIGGGADDVQVCVRNWCHEPMVKLAKDSAFSTGGLVESFAVAFPGNLWARWSMMPAFDFQYRQDLGMLVGWFDRVSLIRNLIESSEGEDWVRCLDMHYFEQTTSGQTNPKTVMFCKGPVDDVDALNMWTRVYDQEQVRARQDLGITQDEDPPFLMMAQNTWVKYHPDRSYEHTLDVASEFGMDYVFIDAIWENEQAYYERVQRERGDKEVLPGNRADDFMFSNMCITLDYRVSEERGGVEAYQRLTERAAEKGVKVITWACSHASPRSAMVQNPEITGGDINQFFAMRESGRHPDTGYPSDCWPLNLNNRAVFEYVRDGITSSLESVVMKGFLWDSFSNLGWWQIDYAGGSLRPQYDKHAELFASYVNRGMYIRPEALVAFSNHSGLAMAGRNVYPPGLLSGYSYNTEIAFGVEEEHAIIKGEKPCDIIFHWLANKHAPSMEFQRIPREQWDESTIAKLKQWFALYKMVRGEMVKRTFLKDGLGVLWEGKSGKQLMFVFKDQICPAGATEVLSGESVTELKAFHAYWLKEIDHAH